MKIAEKTFVMICDDVRNEVGNKLSLMGVYLKNIVVPAVPHTLKNFHIVIFLEGLKKRIKRFKLIFTPPSSTPVEISNDDSSLIKDERKNIHFVFGICPLTIENSGTATIKMFLDGNKEPDIEYDFEISVTKKE